MVVRPRVSSLRSAVIRCASPRSGSAVERKNPFQVMTPPAVPRTAHDEHPVDHHDTEDVVPNAGELDPDVNLRAVRCGNQFKASPGCPRGLRSRVQARAASDRIARCTDALPDWRRSVVRAYPRTAVSRRGRTEHNYRPLTAHTRHFTVPTTCRLHDARRCRQIVTLRLLRGAVLAITIGMTFSPATCTSHRCTRTRADCVEP
jgi:hypothetical protein